MAHVRAAGPPYLATARRAILSCARTSTGLNRVVRRLCTACAPWLVELWGLAPLKMCIEAMQATHATQSLLQSG
jgi:hypothetical protein